MTDVERLIAKGIEMAEEAHQKFRHGRALGVLKDRNDAHEQFMSAVIGTLKEIQTALGQDRVVELVRRGPQK